MTTQTPDAVPVIQADRDAAFSYWLYRGSLKPDDYRAVKWRRELNQGDYDGKEIVQAFARHRLAALDSRAGDAGEGLRMWQVKGPCETIMWETSRTEGQFADPVAALRCALSLPLPATPAPAVDAGTLSAVDDGLGNDWFGDQDRAKSTPAADAVPAGEVGPHNVPETGDIFRDHPQSGFKALSGNRTDAAERS